MNHTQRAQQCGKGSKLIIMTHQISELNQSESMTENWTVKYPGVLLCSPVSTRFPPLLHFLLPLPDLRRHRRVLPSCAWNAHCSLSPLPQQSVLCLQSRSIKRYTYRSAAKTEAVKIIDNDNELYARSTFKNPVCTKSVVLYSTQKCMRKTSDCSGCQMEKYGNFPQEDFYLRMTKLHN